MRALDTACYNDNIRYRYRYRYRYNIRYNYRYGKEYNMLPECPICGKKVDNLATHMATHSKSKKNNRSTVKAVTNNTQTKTADAKDQNNSSIRVAKLKPGRKRGPRCRICGRVGHAHGLCAMHYMRAYRASHSTST